jgi:hypothetical protein
MKTIRMTAAIAAYRLSRAVLALSKTLHPYPRHG